MLKGTTLLTALCLSLAVGAQWVQQTVNTSGNLMCVDYYDLNHVFIGRNSDMTLTSDGGATWQHQTILNLSNVPYSGTTFYDCHFFSPSTGVGTGAVVNGNSYAILRTVNGAFNWNIVWTSNAGSYPRTFNKFSFTSATDGYAVGTNGMIVHTTDAGQTWSTQTSGTLAELYTVEFPTPAVGYIGASGGILKTTNGGSSWIMNTMPGVFVKEIWFANADTGYAAGNTSTAGVFLKTTDGGATWNPVVNPITINEYELTGTGFDTLYLNSGNRMFYTTNGGVWWNYFPNTANHVMNDIAFLGNSPDAYAVGNTGTVYKTGNGGGSVLAPVALAAATSTTTVCVNNSISFTSYGDPSWSYTWLRDNVPVAFTASAAINFPVSGGHSVRLIVENGTYADTSQSIAVTINPLPTVNAINATSSTYSICPGQGVTLLIPNSQPFVTFQAYLNGITPVGPALGGNTGTLGLPITGITSTSNYVISGTATNSCGTTVVWSNTITITVNAVNQALVVDAVHDTICSGSSDTIALYNSVAGVNYVLRIGNNPVSPVQAGNGGTLYFSTGNLTASAVYNILGTNSFGCSAQMVTTATVNVVLVQATIANTFSFLNTNDTIQFTNSSIGDSYLWHFGPGANPTVSTDTNPQVVFNAGGVQNIILDAFGDHGCVSHDTLSVQLVALPAAGNGTLCMSADHNIRYNNGNTGYVVLDYCADQNGFTYATGYYDSSWNNTQYNLFIMKFDPSGQLVWQHKQNPFSYGFNAYVSSSGNSIDVDSAGNFYVAGSFASTTFHIGTMYFANTSYNNTLRSFVVKFDAAGNPVWKIEGYGSMSGVVTGITDIICRNNNELYLSLVSSSWGSYVFTNTSLANQNSCMSVAKIDANGNLLGNVAVNSSSCGVQMYYNPNISSYNINRLAYVGPRLAISADTLYFGAVTTSAMTFGTFTVTAVGNATGLIAKLNMQTMLWTGAYRTFYTTGTAQNRRIAVPVFTVDYTGNVYWAWQMPPQTFSQIAVVGSTTISGTQFSFLSKYKPNGTVEWVLPDNSPNVVVNLSAISGGEIAGYAQSPDTYIPNSDFPLLTSSNNVLYGFPSEGYREGFLFSYTNAGALNWVQRVHGTGDENSMAMTSRCDQIYFIGSSDSVSVMAGDTVATAARSLFLGKYSAGGNCSSPNCSNPFIAALTCQDSTLCPGMCTSITANTSFASGTITYNWMPGNFSAASIMVCPATNTTYTCTMSDTYGHTVVLTQNVTILASPLVNVNGATAVCAGSTVSLTASGANQYSWNPGNLSGNAHVFSPTATTTYTIVGTLSNGCADTASHTVVVNPLPNVAVNFNAIDTLCLSNAIITLAGGSPQGGIYTGAGVSSDSIFNAAQAGAGLHMISYSYTDSLGCTGSASDSIYVDLCLGTDGVSISEELTCFPNPAMNSLTIAVPPRFAGGTIVIFDGDGRRVLSVPTNSTTIVLDVSTLPAGIYSIGVYGQETESTRVFFSKI